MKDQVSGMRFRVSVKQLNRFRSILLHLASGLCVRDLQNSARTKKLNLKLKASRAIFYEKKE